MAERPEPHDHQRETEDRLLVLETKYQMSYDQINEKLDLIVTGKAGICQVHDQEISQSKKDRGRMWWAIGIIFVSELTIVGLLISHVVHT